MKAGIRSNYFKTGLIVLLLAVAGGATYFLYQSKSSNTGVLAFDKDRDSKFLIDSVASDWYWMTNNPDFSVQFMIDNMTPRRDPKYFGKQQIKVMYADGEPTGFIAYFKKNFYEGGIHLLHVSKDHRKKGYASALSNYAVNDLFSQGAKVVKLVTRDNNERARKLYTKLGFTFTGEDDGYAHFEMRK